MTDFGALYASVKNDGKSMGLLIEKYIGKAGRKLFLGFCWLFCLIVIAAFADMVADTFNAYVVTDGVQTLSENATVNGAAGSISLFFIPVSYTHLVVSQETESRKKKEYIITETGKEVFETERARLAELLGNADLMDRA